MILKLSNEMTHSKYLLCQLFQQKTIRTKGN